MQIEQQVSLRDYTTFKIGGPASFFVSVHSLAELEEACAFAKEKSLPVFILGGGSNVLINDEGFSGLVIKNELKGIDVKDNGDVVHVTVAAGEEWDVFVQEIVKRNLYGLENLSGIPGTVGAAPIQNIGAYGTDVSQTIVWVEAMHMITGKLHQFSYNECDFSYRDSFFKTEKGKHYIVTQVCFRLTRNGVPNTGYKDVASFFSDWKEAPTLVEMRDAILAIRGAKFPDLDMLGTAGSYFKNPVIARKKAEELQHQYPQLPVYSVDAQHSKISIAWIMDHVFNLKSVREGAVGTAPNHVLAVVNYEQATAKDVLAFTEKIQQRVKEKFDINIVPEVTFIDTK